MFRRIGAGLLKNIVEQGFFCFLLQCFQWIVVKIVQIVYKVLIVVIKIIVNIAKKILFLLDFPIGLFIRWLIVKTTPVQANKIMFLTFQGDYTCNPKSIAERIIAEDLGWDMIWDVKTNIPTSEYPLELKFVKHGTLEFYKSIASAKIIVENTNIVERLHIHKKKNQYLFQTWHGSLGIKRLDGDVVMGLRWKLIARACQKKVDFLLSNSSFETEVYHGSYWKDVPVLLTGHARNDVFFANAEERERIRKKVYRHMGVSAEKRLFLFAPTHRDNVEESYYGLDYSLIKAALEERFGGEWQIVVRLHNRLKKQSEQWLKALPSYVSNGTMYEDMQELLVAVEAGVTDYSSWIFDYLLTGKPAFIIEIGLDTFAEQRGFYYPIETTPFPIAKDSRELASNIRSFNEEKYKNDSERFLQERGCMEDGHACERIVGKMKELMENQ